METEIAQRVAEKIEQARLKQVDVARELGITASQLSKSLAGTRQFSSVELADLADILDTSMYWLVTGKADPNEYRLVARHSYDHSTKSYSAEAWEHDRPILDAIALVFRQAKNHV